MESPYQKGVALKATAQQAADEAAENLDKAQTDFKLAQASGDKEKIKAAHAALEMAKSVAANKARVLNMVSALADRLKVIQDKAYKAAAAVASAKTPAHARKALNDLERLANIASGELASIEKVMKWRTATPSASPPITRIQ